MQTYKYVAQTLDGTKVKGVQRAVDEFTALDRIKARYPTVIDIKEVKESPLDKILNFEIGKKVDLKNLSVMCSQFSIVLSSGVPVDKCLSMIADQTKDKKLRKMLELSSEDVSQGTPIATAFEKNYNGLPVTFIETVRAGEESGTLDSSFQTLQEYYEKSYGLNQKVKSALSYPLFVMVVGAAVVVVIMAFVMPKFVGMFNDLGGEIPGITKFLIGMTDFFKAYWWLIFLIMIGIFAAYKLYVKTRTGRITWAKLMLKLPIIGNLNTLQAATEFASTMSTLLSAGLTVGDALEVTSRVISNAQLSDDVHGMTEKIVTGQDLGTVMKQNKYFPQVLKEMTAVGEQTGELEMTLKTIARYYTNEYNYAVTGAVAKMEPMLMVGLAGFAGFIVLALYLPMFSMYNYM